MGAPYLLGLGDLLLLTHMKGWGCIINCYEQHSKTLAGCLLAATKNRLKERILFDHSKTIRKSKIICGTLKGGRVLGECSDGCFEEFD